MFMSCYGRMLCKVWIYCALWQGVLLYWTTMAEIFRGELCKSVGFKLKGTDKVLIGCVIDTQYVTGKMACLVKCVEHPLCNSVNFEETMGINNAHICELNCQKKEPTFSKYFLARPSFSYYELDGDIKSVNDCTKSPCLNGATCINKVDSICQNRKTFCKCASGYEGIYCEKFYPKRCKDYQNIGGNKTDGEYLMYLKRPVCNKAVKIYCADMTTARPLEYVTLPAGKTKNFVVRFRNNENEREETSFEKIRLNVSGMYVLGKDYKFATTDVLGAFYAYGSAHDCLSPSCDGNARRGHFSVDVTGTSFRLPPSIPYTFYSNPVCVRKIYYPSMSDERLRWSGKCGGYCGSCKPVKLLLQIADGC